jgi:hypothetical protein
MNKKGELIIVKNHTDVQTQRKMIMKKKDPMIENEKMKLLKNSPRAGLKFLSKVQYSQAIRGVRS